MEPHAHTHEAARLPVLLPSAALLPSAGPLSSRPIAWLWVCAGGAGDGRQHPAGRRQADGRVALVVRRPRHLALPRRRVGRDMHARARAHPLMCTAHAHAHANPLSVWRVHHADTRSTASVVCASRVSRASTTATCATASSSASRRSSTRPTARTSARFAWRGVARRGLARCSVTS